MRLHIALRQSTLSSETRQPLKQDGASPDLSGAKTRSYRSATASGKTNAAIMNSSTIIVGTLLALLYTRDPGGRSSQSEHVSRIYSLSDIVFIGMLSMFPFELSCS